MPGSCAGKPGAHSGKATSASSRARCPRVGTKAASSSAPAEAGCRRGGRGTLEGLGPGRCERGQNGRYSGGTPKGDGRLDGQEPSKGVASECGHTPGDKASKGPYPRRVRSRRRGGGRAAGNGSARPGHLKVDLTKSKKKADTLESILDGSGSAEASGSSGTSRKNVAVMRALKAALQERPKELADGILARMAKTLDCGGQVLVKIECL